MTKYQILKITETKYNNSINEYWVIEKHKALAGWWRIQEKYTDAANETRTRERRFRSFEEADEFLGTITKSIVTETVKVTPIQLTPDTA